MDSASSAAEADRLWDILLALLSLSSSIPAHAISEALLSDVSLRLAKHAKVLNQVAVFIEASLFLYPAQTLHAPTPFVLSVVYPLCM